METNDFLSKIKESFDPKLITALFKNFSNQYIALFELIDNAVDDRIEDRKLSVHLNYDEDDRKITIRNYNGRGMDIKRLVKYFTWGGSEKEHRIGRYGQGGKAALGYLADSFVIKSHPANSMDGYVIKVDDWHDREKGFKELEIQPYKCLEENIGEVSIEISNLKKDFEVDTIKRKIADTYRPLITKRKVEFFVNTEEVACPCVNYDKDTLRDFCRDIHLDGIKYVVSGEYGIVSDIKSPRGGFNVYQFGRRVAKKEYFGHIDPSRRWNVERLYGELYIDFEIPLLMNKSDIDRDSQIWNEITQEMYSEIKEIIQDAIDYKVPTKKEEKNVNKLSKKIKGLKRNGPENLSLANYGGSKLFKLEKGCNGAVSIKIDRDHKAYKKWTTSKENRDTLYCVMILSIHGALEKVGKKEAKTFLNNFSESLKEHTHKLL